MPRATLSTPERPLGSRRGASDPLSSVARALTGGLLQPGQAVVVAVSGGADSVFLLWALHQLAGRWRLALTVAHLDHGWRGPAGEADAAWVAELAGRLGLPARIGRVDAPAVARAERRSPEDAARRLRYAFLRDVCRRAGATAVATGHTADDQVETVLLALLRGSGPAGLAGMARTAPLPAPGSDGLRIVRPLLGLERDAVRAALRRIGQEWREDATNLDPHLPRNRLRLEVLPLLEAIAPGYRRTVGRAAALAGQMADYLSREGQRAGEALFRRHGTTLAADRRALLGLHPAVRSEALRWAVARLRESPGAALGEALEEPPGGPASAPEWAHLQGALDTLERGRGGAVAWLARGVRLRLERGRAVLEPAPGPPASDTPDRPERVVPSGRPARGRILDRDAADRLPRNPEEPEEPCR